MASTPDGMSANVLPLAAGTRVADLARLPPLDPTDLRILVCHALGLTRTELITRGERRLDAGEAQRLSALLERRLAGEPVAYLVGAREFRGLAFEVTPDVLIPRPETELLVDLALERLPPGPRQPRLLDLGTGSGAIAVAIAHERPDTEVVATDTSAAALAVAERNARRHGARLALRRADWYTGLDDADFDVIVSNPPYIAAGDTHLSQGDLRFEPASALTDGADGLSALREIVDGAPRRLRTIGWVLLEHGYDQAAAVRALLTTAGFGMVRSWEDLAGIERVSGGRLLSSTN
ncbi:MAG: peptide chain release factor N(5)-glutamine methyltransferase [Burkholderiaceae bacterium]